MGFEEAQQFLDGPAATHARQEVERLHDDPAFRQIVEAMHRMAHDPAVQQVGDDEERTWREVRSWEQAMLALGMAPLDEPAGTPDQRRPSNAQGAAPEGTAPCDGCSCRATAGAPCYCRPGTRRRG